jgi:hypothetical protein
MSEWLDSLYEAGQRVSGEVGLVAAVKLAYRFALDPTAAQERALRSHAGAARFGWNWALARCRERYAAERKWYSAADLHKLWNAAKKADPALGWWSENSKCCYQEAFRNLDRALSDFARSRRGQRKGKRLGFPRFKKRGRSRDSFRLTGTIRCAGNTVTLPRLGVIAACEPTGKLPGRSRPGCAGSGGPRGRTPASSPARPGGGSPRPGWPGCTPGSRTCAPTRCTRPPACSPPGTKRSRPRT